MGGRTKAMELDVNEKESAAISDAELGERVTRYMDASLGKPKQAGQVWNSIAERLGEQEGRASAEFARSLNGLYSGDRAAQGTAVAKPKVNSATPLQGNGLNRATQARMWNPALAAGVVLAIMGLLATVLALSGGSGGMVSQPAVPTFSPVPALSTITVDNPGFEKGFEGWSKADRRDYSIAPDSAEKHSGQYSLRIKSNPGKLSSVSAAQMITTSQALGSRVRLSGYIKTKDVIGAAFLILRVSGQQVEGKPWPYITAFDNMGDRAPAGTTDWTRYDLVVDVPKDSSNIMLGIGLMGGGQMWVDDLTLDQVDTSVATTNIESNRELQNVDFEDGGRWWGFSGSYAVKTIDTLTRHSGKQSLGLEQTAQDFEDTSGYTQSVLAEKYAGKRVRFSAYVKTEDVQGTMGLWFQGRSTLINRVTDEMETRPVFGTTDWTLYETVVDVPADCTLLAMGVQMHGPGKLWIDDAKLEVVGEEVPTTNIPVLATLGNGDFETGTKDWQLVSTRPAEFETGSSKEQAYAGSNGAYVRVLDGKTDRTASLQQTINVEAYQEKTIQVTAYINKDKVKGDAFLWGSIYDAMTGGPTTLQESHTPVRPNEDATGWQKYAIIFYVPKTAETITLGVKLTGEGEVWIDDVTLGPVPLTTVAP